MKIVLSALVILLFTHTAIGQYYYNDLLTSADLMKKRELYQVNKVKAVQYYSFDNNNQPIQGFQCEQTVTNNFTQISTTTTAPLTGTTQSISTFSTTGQLAKSLDTSEGNKTVLTYTFDGTNRITEVSSQSISPGNYINSEQHLWFYKNGKPEKMLKVKNRQDTTYITFVLDEQGNVAEERSVYHHTQQPTVFYYYDNNNRLTDIVRYNTRAKRLLPDYVFEYNEKGQTASMLVTAEGAIDYQKWYYTYDDKGLKTKDICYSKAKELIGKIEYRYQF